MNNKCYDVEKETSWVFFFEFEYMTGELTVFEYETESCLPPYCQGYMLSFITRNHLYVIK